MIFGGGIYIGGSCIDMVRISSDDKTKQNEIQVGSKTIVSYTSINRLLVTGCKASTTMVMFVATSSVLSFFHGTIKRVNSKQQRYQLANSGMPICRSDLFHFELFEFEILKLEVGVKSEPRGGRYLKPGN